jgi:hypothetical protein
LAYAAPATNPITTEGDLVIGDASGDAVRLPIGAAGTVLTSDGDTADWAAPAGASENYSLLNTGGTALTGSGTITVSGISGINKFLVVITAASSATSTAFIHLRINTDSGSNYSFYGNVNVLQTSYNENVLQQISQTSVTEFSLGRMNNNAASQVFAACSIDGGLSTGTKKLQVNSASTPGGGIAGGESYNIQGLYAGSAVITSISVITSAGNFDNGTLFVYGSAA